MLRDISSVDRVSDGTFKALNNAKSQIKTLVVSFPEKKIVKMKLPSINFPSSMYLGINVLIP